MKHIRNLLTPAISMILILSLALDSVAQEKGPVVKSASIMQLDSSERLPAELQRQLEYESALLANPNCGSDCKPSPGAILKNPDGDGGETRYTCNSGNCACSGACQCVAMEDICMPDTMGCSDYGCTCKQKAGSEPEQPNC
ncbi:MAG: hypothetical protein GWM87_08520 [Xanthomonadales bacterium]|nr:hypothetical protein [Xanthomonadales bacterium]NIX12967.1 hypothetical protein [Xanthomonadales bacterium]